MCRLCSVCSCSNSGEQEGPVFQCISQSLGVCESWRQSKGWRLSDGDDCHEDGGTESRKFSCQVNLGYSWAWLFALFDGLIAP